MKIKITCLLLFLSLHALAGSRDTVRIFRKGYSRIGFSTLGKSLETNLSPQGNVFNGRYGASMGFVGESGHIYYFKAIHPSTKLNYGLDWTIISITYNKLDKWDAYGQAAGFPDAETDGSKIAGSIASKLGPVLSFNPFEKVVIDVRFQVIPMVRFFDLDYSDSGRNFSFNNDDSDNSSWKDRLAFGVNEGFGLTIKRKAFGLAFDYITGKVNSSYDASNGPDDHSFGKAKIPAQSLQIKLSLSL